MDTFVLDCLRRGLLPLLINDELYFAEDFEVGWWVWRPEYSAPEYFVDKAAASCTCPAPGVCKHRKALRPHVQVRRV